MEKTESRMRLPKVDSLFTTQEERDSFNLEKVVDISISDIDDFPNHPFKVIINDELREMSESIKEKGVLSPALVRKKANGKYEMISGHRRKKASELANLSTIPCIVRNLSDEEATIIMVDSNLQREKVLPSERAFAYKMKLEALNHQGKRSDLTSVENPQKLPSKTSRRIVAEQVGESEDKIRRYIRLTYLIPKLLDYVDNYVIKDKDKVRIALSPAVEISYLTKEEQESLLDYIEMNEITPSQSQAIELKNMSQEKTFTVEKMEALLDEEKPNQTPTLKVSMNKLKNVLPRTLKNDREREEYVIKAVEFYDRYQKRVKEQQMVR